MKSWFLLVSALISLAATAEPIEDNSFLVEEAYNQESGVVQFINVFQKNQKGQDWAYTFINEIPVGGQSHQFSYELPLQHLSSADKTQLSDIKLNYRYEFVRAEKAVATGRLSATAPTGDRKEGFGNEAVGYEAALVTSITIADRWRQHWNVGYGFTPGAKNATGDKADNNRYFWAVSNVFLITDRFNFMLEMAGSLQQETTGPDTGTWGTSNIISPSLRYGVDIGEWQIVPGLAYPITVGAAQGEENQFLAYLSIEGPVF